LLNFGEVIHTELRRVVRNIVAKKVIIDDDGCLLFTTWFSSITLNGNKSIVFTFDKKARPYLFQLGRSYTENALGNIKDLQNKYSIKVYEMLKSAQRQGRDSLNLTLDEMKDRLGVGSKYTRIGDLKRRILDEVKDDISRHTDLHLDYFLLKTGRKYTDIRFDFEAIIEAVEALGFENELLKQVNIDGLDEYIMNHSKSDSDLKKMAAEEKNQMRKKYAEAYFNHMLTNIENDVLSDFCL
jgi:plasmid replication initiation protein